MRKFMRMAGLIVSLAALLVLRPRPAAAADQVVWQIGTFDKSGAEFNQHPDISNPQYNPVYTVGKSNPAVDWPATQPGSRNISQGSRPHPYTIIFSLPHQPKGEYTLNISHLIKHHNPKLSVSINGKTGLFYTQNEQRNEYGMLNISLPAEALRRGENTLILTAMDDPGGEKLYASLQFDALSLTNGSPRARAQAPGVTVTPTIFFKGKPGDLREAVEATVTLDQKVRKGQCTLSVGKESIDQALSSEPDFGQQRFELLVPEFAAATPAVMTVEVNGKSFKTSFTLDPQRKWSIFVVPHAHLDIGYTDFQARVAEVQNRNIDKLLEEIAQHPEMRISLDGSWIVKQYLASRADADKKDFLDLARDGKIGVPAQYVNELTGYATLEELIRSTSYSQGLHREYGIPFDYANITDVPSYSWSYASVLSSAGIHYFAAGSNRERGAILPFGRWDQVSPYWWQGPDGQKVLMSYQQGYGHLSSFCGVPFSVSVCRINMPAVISNYRSPSYKPDAILIFGSQGENTDLIPGEPELLAEWNSQYAYPHMVFGRFADYFRYIDEHFGTSLPTVVGGGGDYWEDDMGTDALSTIIDRATQQRALSAEKLSTLVTYVDKNWAGPAEAIRNMWANLIMYAEHTFSWGGSYVHPFHAQTVRQLEVKNQFALDSRAEARAVLGQSLDELQYQVRLKPPFLLIFNSLNWPRSGLVYLDLNDNQTITEVPSGAPVPVEVVGRDDASFAHVRFMAYDVPSMGYKCYRLEKTAGPGVVRSLPTALPASNVEENRFYRVEVDPAAGVIKSVYDKELQRELVDKASPYGLDQYLYVAGGDELPRTQIVFPDYTGEGTPPAKLTISPAQTGRVTRLVKTAYGQVLTLQGSGLHAPTLETQIVLFDDEKKIEFINRLHKEAVPKKEAVYFVFPFAIPDPAFSYEIQNGTLDPAHDLMKGACLEWFAVQHWVKVAGNGVAVGLVPVDAPLVSLGDINRGVWPREFTPKTAGVYSYVMNNYWYTNTQQIQEGDYTFRYVLTSGQNPAPESLARLGRAAMTPLELGEAVSNDKFGDPPTPLSPQPTSFLSVNNPNLVVVNWKVADDKQGTILRLLEVGGASGMAHLNFDAFALQHAWIDNAAEANLQELQVSPHTVEVPFQPHEILTVRIEATGISR
jgi:hypothetical protein